MANYIDEAYYINNFRGTPIPSSEFDSLARAASDLIDSIVSKPIENITENVKKATAYEVEMLFAQGGADAISGFASAGAASERLGDYSIGGEAKATADSKIAMYNGIPVSSIAVSFLRRDGLMSRWWYSEVNDSESYS